MTGSTINDERTITPTVLPPLDDGIVWSKTAFRKSYGARFYVNGSVHIVWGFVSMATAWGWITAHSFHNLGETANVVEGTDDGYQQVFPSPRVRTLSERAST